MQALDGVTLELHRHEVVGLIGPNGAGKSTLVNVLTGFDTPTSGSVELGEREVTGWSPHRRARAGIARTFQHSRSFRGLTVRENIEVAALGSGQGRAPLEPGRRADSSGSAWTGTPMAGELAHGDERLLGVARALATEPRSCCSTSRLPGMPEAEVDGVRAASSGRSREDFDAGVLLIDHNMALVMGVCDRIHVLDQGRTLAEGTPAEIRANLDVTSAYLGESAVAE